MSQYDYDDEAEFAAWEEYSNRQDEARAQAADAFADMLSTTALRIADESDSYDEARGVAVLILEADEFLVVDDMLRAIFWKG